MARRLLDRVFGIDLRTLGALRIGLALYVLFDLVNRAVDLEAHYTDAGIFPRALLSEYAAHENYWWQTYGVTWINYWSLHTLTGSLAGAACLFLLHGIAALMLLAGWKSRFAVFATWLLSVSVQNRNPMIMNGGDQMLRALLFWAMFLPLGARFSVDGACATLKAYGQPAPTRTLSVATAALLLQTCLVYWFTFWLKDDPIWRREGAGLYYALSLDQCVTFLGKQLLRVPWLCTIGNWGTLALEALGPTLAVSPVATERIRMVLVPLFWAFHLLGVGLFLDVGPLPGSSALLWIAFLPGTFWDCAARWWTVRRGRPFVDRIDALHTWLVALRNRRVAARVARRAPLPLLDASPLAQGTALFFLAYVIAWNFGVVPRPLHWINKFARVNDHNWGMFAPKPLVEDGWYVLPARRVDGVAFDLLRGGPVDWSKPADVAGTYPNERWRKYRMTLWQQGYRYQWLHYGRYLCRWWNRTHTGGERLQSFQAYFLLETTPPPGSPSPVPRKVLLWSQNGCASGDETAISQ